MSRLNLVRRPSKVKEVAGNAPTIPATKPVVDPPVTEKEEVPASYEAGVSKISLEEITAPKKEEVITEKVPEKVVEKPVPKTPAPAATTANKKKKKRGGKKEKAVQGLDAVAEAAAKVIANKTEKSAPVVSEKVLVEGDSFAIVTGLNADGVKFICPVGSKGRLVNFFVPIKHMAVNLLAQSGKTLLKYGDVVKGIPSNNGLIPTENTGLNLSTRSLFEGNTAFEVLHEGELAIKLATEHMIEGGTDVNTLFESYLTATRKLSLGLVSTATGIAHVTTTIENAIELNDNLTANRTENTATENTSENTTSTNA